MKSARPPQTEKLQEMRFTVRDPILDEALISLEEYGRDQSEYVSRNLFLYAMRRMRIDKSDMYDGYSQNQATFDQYAYAIDKISNHGQKRFQLDDWMHELYAGGPDGTLVGVEMRVVVDHFDINTMIAPPLVGPIHHRAPISGQQIEQDQSALNVLKEYRRAGVIPVRYEIEKTVADPAEALERLGGVLALGAWVSELAIVPSVPRSARSTSKFMQPPIERTFKRVDTLFARELLPDLSEPFEATSGTE